MRVSVSGHQFVFPRVCACCGGFPQTWLPVCGSEANKRARTKGWVWEIPYCVACKRHIKAAEIIQLFWLLLGVISCLTGFVTAVLMRRWILGVQLLAFLHVTSTVACCLSWFIVKRRCPASCTGMGRTVHYLGSAGPCHTFELRSWPYAVGFVRSNKRKIVNANLAVVSILRATQFAEHQVPRRRLRE